MVEKYQEARDVANHLEGIIEGENGVGGANVLHFDAAGTLNGAIIN